MKVQSPDGMTWRVSRRWVPWRRRVRNTTDGLPDVPEGGFGDDPISLVLGLLLLVLLLPFLLLVLVAGLELLLILLVLPFALLGRIVLGGEWTIELRRGWTPYWEERVEDWQRTGLRIREVAYAVRLGHAPPPNLGRDA